MFKSKRLLENFEKIYTRGRIHSFIYECDFCHVIYELKELRKAKKGRIRFSFCSDTCKFSSRKKGQKLCQQMVQSAKENNLVKYGVDNPMKLEEFQQKHRQTFVEKYGVESPLQVPEFKKKRDDTHRENHGTEHTFRVPEFLDARNKTWRATQRVFGPSKPELRFLEILKNNFKEVVHQRWIHKWPIDYYIADNETYVQFDGVYWHGIDKTLEELLENPCRRNETIYEHKIRDQIQDEWFKNHNLRLVRVTDRDVDNDCESIIALLQKSH
jgi:hypothetical protein